MFCSQCGKAPTKNKTKGGNRTIDPITTICNECDPNLGNTGTGQGGARGKETSDSSDTGAPKSIIPEEIANKSGAELSATDIYTIVTSAMQVTNKKIDDLQNDLQNKMVTLENKVRILETENEKKDEDINTLKHTVISMQKAFNSLDQEERSTKAVIQHLPETDMDGNADDDDKLTNDVEKIHQICKFMGHNLNEESLRNMKISRIGQQREGFPRMIKIEFANKKDRDAFVKNSSKMKEAPETWKKVYIKKTSTPYIFRKTTDYVRR